MRATGSAVSILCLLAMASLGGGLGCGAPAKAEPLEVTYYYLPG